MTENDSRKKLTKLQRLAVVAIVSNKTAKAAAIACGASESTIYKYFKNPRVMEAVRSYEKGIRDNVGYRLAIGANDALDIVEGVAKGEIVNTRDTNASVRLRAANIWLDQLYKTQDMTSLEARVSSLEANQQ